MEKVREVLDHEATGNDRNQRSTLTRLMQLLDPPGDSDPSGWSLLTARLFAIDAALTAIRRRAGVLSEAERHNLTSYLEEAKDLVLSNRDDELGLIQAAIEAQLSLVAPGERRHLWLTAIDALIPSPYRAALVSTDNAISLGIPGILADLSTLLRDSLAAEPDTRSVRLEPTARLHITA